MLNKLNINEIGEHSFLINENSVNYLALVGSHSYGGNTEDSDYDFYGFTVPPVGYVFPHVWGKIDGFEDAEKFDQWEKIGIQTELGKTDITVYNIVKYFKLVMDCNPNMIHSLFVPGECVIKQDKIGALVRANRNLFLSQQVYYTFKGMAFSHLKKMQNRKRSLESKRAKFIEEYGYDTKDASYCIRLIYELRDILTTGTLKIDKYGELIKKIRYGYYTLPELLLMYHEVADDLEEQWNLGQGHTISWAVDTYPNKEKIRKLLIDCFEVSGYPLNDIGFNSFRA